MIKKTLSHSTTDKERGGKLKHCKSLLAQAHKAGDCLRLKYIYAYFNIVFSVSNYLIHAVYKLIFFFAVEIYIMSRARSIVKVFLNKFKMMSLFKI